MAIAAAKGIESGAVAGAGMMDAYLDSIMQTAKRKSQQVTNPTKNDITQHNQITSQSTLKTTTGNGFPSVDITMTSPQLTATGYASGFKITVTGVIDSTVTVTLTNSTVEEGSTLTPVQEKKFEQEAKAQLGNAFLGLSIKGGSIGRDIENPKLIVGCKLGEFEVSLDNIEYTYTPAIQTFNAKTSLKQQNIKTIIDDTNLDGNINMNFLVTGIRKQSPQGQQNLPVTVSSQQWYKLAMVEIIKVFEPFPMKASRELNTIQDNPNDQNELLNALVATMVTIGFTVKTITGF